MKKLKYLILVCILFMPLLVSAAGNVSVNKSSISIEEGKSTTFSVTASNAAGKVTLSSSDSSVCTINKSSEWVENASLSVSLAAIKPGKSTITINVDAATFDEEVIKKTYTISVNVTEKKASVVDDRDKNNNLSSLSISNLDLEFNKNTTEYSIKVDHNINEITIDGKTESSKAKVTGLGTKTINDYQNIFEIKVTAENGSVKTYKIEIVRADEKGNYKMLSNDNYLKELKIDGYEIEFDTKNYEYFIDVENNISELKIDAVTNDTFAKYVINNNKNFKEGFNKVEIVVTSESGNDKIYSIYVNKKTNLPTIELKDIDNIKDITDKKIVIEIKDENTILTKEMIETLKENKKEIVINNYSNGRILYSWNIDTKNMNKVDEFDTKIEFNSKNKDKIDELTNYANAMNLDFSYSGELPESTKIKVYVGNNFNDDEKINIYHYNNKKNKLELINNNIKAKDGYVELNLNHCSEYVLTKSNIKTLNYNIYLLTICILETITLIVIVVLTFLKKIKFNMNAN